MKTLSIAILLVSVLMACQRNAIAQQTVSTKEDTCLHYLQRYSDFWKKDSVGQNGFRELFGYKILWGSDFKGRQWKDIAEYLGQPNFTQQVFGKTEYRYRLNHYSNSIKDIGTLLLDVVVNKEGVITLFAIYEVDG